MVSCVSNNDVGSYVQDQSIQTDRKIGLVLIIAGMLIFFSGWVNVYGLTIHRLPTDPPSLDPELPKDVSHYYRFGVWDFNKIVAGIILISVGATLILWRTRKDR